MLDQIIQGGRMAKDVSQEAYAKDLIGEFVNSVIGEGQTVSNDVAEAINARIAEIDEVVAAYGRRVDTAEGRVVVTAVTAIPLTPELREQIREKVRAQTGRDAEIEETVDPSIVGGLVLRVGDVVVDASLRTRLEEMRRSLESAPVDLSTAVEA